MLPNVDCWLKFASIFLNFGCRGWVGYDEQVVEVFQRIRQPERVREMFLAREHVPAK